jgi:hypothetical protein
MSRGLLVVASLALAAATTAAPAAAAPGAAPPPAGALRLSPRNVRAGAIYAVIARPTAKLETPARAPATALLAAGDRVRCVRALAFQSTTGGTLTGTCAAGSRLRLDEVGPAPDGANVTVLTLAPRSRLAVSGGPFDVVVITTHDAADAAVGALILDGSFALGPWRASLSTDVAGTLGLARFAGAPDAVAWLPAGSGPVFIGTDVIGATCAEVCCDHGLAHCGATCIDLDADPGHCGACGALCATGACEDGDCNLCVGVTCTSPDACHVPGTCDPPTGVCSPPPPASDGTPCNDADACTVRDACAGGTCTGADPASCMARENLALGRPASQSSDYSHPCGALAPSAVDGNTDGDFGACSTTHTTDEFEPWWQVDLGAPQRIERIDLWNRTDCCGERLHDFDVMVSNDGTGVADPVGGTYFPGVAAAHEVFLVEPVVGRYVRVQLRGPGILSLAEVQVSGCAPPPAFCDDTNVCTADTCVSPGGCRNTSIPCDDADPCTVGTCDPVAGCAHVPRTCDDGEPCTVDSCDPPSGDCLHEALPAAPWRWEMDLDGSNSGGDSGDLVLIGGAHFVPGGRGGRAFDPAGGYAVAGADVPESDFTIALWFRTTAADAGGLFSVVDSPSGGFDRELRVRGGKLEYYVWPGATSHCEGAGPDVHDGAWHHAAIVCESGVSCRLLLDGVAICTSSAADSMSNFNGQTAVVIGRILAGFPFAGLIDRVTVWSAPLRRPHAAEPEGGACGAEICVPRTCAAGACTAGALVCDDGELCTDDGCSELAGCDHTNNSAPCDDGDACTTGDACNAGGCIAGVPVICDEDGDPCTGAVCDPVSGCTHPPISAALFRWPFEGNGSEASGGPSLSFFGTVAFAGGRFGSGYASGGSTAAVDANVPEQDFTISAWFRTSNPNAGGIFEVRDPATGGYDRSLHVSEGHLGYYVWPGSTSACRWDGIPVADDQWHQGAIVCETGVSCRLVLDGITLCESVAADSTSGFDWQTQLVVGTSHSTGDIGFDGIIDEVVVAAQPHPRSSGPPIAAPGGGCVTACADGGTCTGGTCTGGTALTCDDGDVCTVDTCVLPGGCRTDPGPDGAPCVGGGGCADGQCSAGACAGVTARPDCTACGTGDLELCAGGVCGGVPRATEEGFEADALPEGWTTSGDAVWSTVADVFHGGARAARSGAIGDNGRSVLSLAIELEDPGEVSFWHMEDTEADYDFLTFVVDGANAARWSGTGGWAQHVGVLTEGAHVLEWHYTKDVSLAQGRDAVWIDDVVVRPRCEDGACVREVAHGGACVACARPDGTSCDTDAGDCTSSACSGGACVDDLAPDCEECGGGGTRRCASGQCLEPAGAILTERFDAEQIPARWGSGGVPWFTDATTSAAGGRSARSGVIGHNATSSLTLAVDLPADAVITWWHMEDTEACCDTLYFNVDGSIVEFASGQNAWRASTASLAAGVHTLAWHYTKDVSDSVGRDAVWIDEVTIAIPGLCDTANECTAGYAGAECVECDVADGTPCAAGVCVAGVCEM